MLLYKINSSIKLSKIQTNKIDILIFCEEDEGKSEIMNFSVNGKERNIQMEKKKNVGKILQETEELLVLGGYFNRPVALKGKQKLYTKGNMILASIEKFNLIILNNDDVCEGAYTWVEMIIYKSITDFALTNKHCIVNL